MSEKPKPGDVEEPREPVRDPDACAACGHRHVNGRSGSCSVFTCPCAQWQSPSEAS